MSEVASAIGTIQDILAPAVMITGVALLLLTFNTRHSSLVNRIRLLDDEKRQINRTMTASGKEDASEAIRLRSISSQLKLLLPRLAYVRNGMLCHLVAVLFFVLTSFSIGLERLSPPAGLAQTAISVTFTLGMLHVLIGVMFLALEIFVSFRVIVVEVNEAVS